METIAENLRRENVRLVAHLQVINDILACIRTLMVDVPRDICSENRHAEPLKISHQPATSESHARLFSRGHPHFPIPAKL